MTLEQFNPAILNFLAGVTVSAAVTLVVSPAVCPTCEALPLYIMAAPWAAIGLLLSLTAALLENSRREADYRITPETPESMRKEIYKSYFDPVRIRVKIYLLLAGIFVFLALILQIFLFKSA